MKILAIGHDAPNTKPDDFRPYLKDEAAKVWELYQSGVLREIYFRQDQPDAVLILECKDVAEAQAVLNTLPLVEKGLITFEVIPLGPYRLFQIVRKFKVTQPIIVARQLTKRFRTPNKAPGIRGAFRHLVHPQYDEKIAVNAIDLSISSGESVAYVGPNGAGKSTTLKMLTGILVPSSGEIYVNNLIPHKQRIINNRTIGVVFGQRSQLWWDLPVQESFRLLGDIYEIPESTFTTNLNEFIELLDLEPLLSKPTRYLSLGQRMRCDLAASLLHAPSILYLDEPTIGLDVAAKVRIRDFIKRINQERNVTVILTSHDLGDIEDTCQRLIMINQGQTAYDGSFQAIKQRFGRERVLRLLLKEPLPTAKAQAQQAIDGLFPLHIEQPEPHQIIIRFDNNQSTAGAIVNNLWSVLPVADLQIEEPSVEFIIRQLYEGQLQFDEGDE